MFVCDGVAPLKLTSPVLRSAGNRKAQVLSFIRKPFSTGSIPLRRAAARIQFTILYSLPLVGAECAEATLHPGDVASQKPLQQSLSKLEAAYRRKGYMDVVVTSTPQLNTSAHTVTFGVAVIPGEPYKLSTVTPLHLNPTQKADFDKTWKLKPGDIYDESYVGEFLHNNTAVKTLEPLTASYKTIANPEAHTVELILEFKGPGTVQ